jgi:hypothetical protein
MPFATYFPVNAGDFVIARRFLDNTVVPVQDDEGHVIDEVPVLAGEWVLWGVEAPYTLSAEQFAAEFVSMGEPEDADDDRVYVRRAPAIVATFDNGNMLIENGAVVPAAEFLTRHMLCRQDGTPLTTWAGLSGTALRLREDPSPEARAHLEVLKAYRQFLGQTMVVDARVQADLHVFDLEMGDATALPPVTVVPVEDQSLAAEDIPHAVRKTLARLGFEEYAHQGLPFMPVIAMRQMMLAAGAERLWNFGKRLMEGISQRPVESIICVKTMHSNLNPLVAIWDRLAGDEAETIHPEELAMMPGYEPGRIERYDLDGVSYLYVDDMEGVSLYAWPAFPKHDLQRKM